VLEILPSAHPSMIDHARACRCPRKAVLTNAKHPHSAIQPFVETILEEKDEPLLITNGSGGARIYNYMDGMPFVMKVRMHMKCRQETTTVFEWSVTPYSEDNGKMLMYRPELSIPGMERIVESLRDKLILLESTMDMGSCDLTEAEIFLPACAILGITNPPLIAHTAAIAQQLIEGDKQVVLVSVEITKVDPDNIATWVSANGQTYPRIPVTNKNEQPRYVRRGSDHLVLQHEGCSLSIKPAGIWMAYATYIRTDGVIEPDTSKPIIYTSHYRDSHVILQNRLSLYIDNVTSEPYYVCEYTINQATRALCYQVIVCERGMERLFEYVHEDLTRISEQSIQTSVYMIMSNGFDMSARVGRKLTNFNVDSINPIRMFVSSGVRCTLNPCVTYAIDVSDKTD
jgi:hypothetical protein